MDWLMCIMMIILFAAVLVLLWKNYRIKKEAKLFAEKVEDALDAIVTGKEWNMEEELEDSLWGRTGTQLVKAGHVFRNHVRTDGTAAKRDAIYSCGGNQRKRIGLRIPDISFPGSRIKSRNIYFSTPD